MYNFLFGPVPSRRLGISLGVDLVPHKTCSLNCVYCECGATTVLTLKRKPFIPTADLISELTAYLNTKPHLDYITFSGAGEPTLNSDIGTIVNFIKDNYPDYKLALITNGTLANLLTDKDGINKLDLILPSLDAAIEQTFRKINRPIRSLKLASVIAGLVKLRQKFSGKIWLEIFIIPQINDSEKDIVQLGKAIRVIKPDRVQLNTLDRPAAYPLLQPASKQNLERIARLINWETEIIANFTKSQGKISFNTDIENTILQTIKRRPCTFDDLRTTLGLHSNEINKYLQTLLNQNKIKSKPVQRGIFYMAKN